MSVMSVRFHPSLSARTHAMEEVEDASPNPDMPLPLTPSSSSPRQVGGGGGAAWSVRTAWMRYERQPAICNAHTHTGHGRQRVQIGLCPTGRVPLAIILGWR